jgi:hypothetical protein
MLRTLQEPHDLDHPREQGRQLEVVLALTLSLSSFEPVAEELQAPAGLSTVAEPGF